MTGNGGHDPGSEDERLAELEARSVVDAELIARLHAEGVIDREKIANLETALITCRQIGAAIGILMATHKITEDAGFALLVTASQRGAGKLRNVALHVIRTGSLDA